MSGINISKVNTGNTTSPNLICRDLVSLPMVAPKD